MVVLSILVVLLVVTPVACADIENVTLAEIKKDITYLITQTNAMNNLLCSFDARIQKLELGKVQAEQSTTLLVDHEQRIRVIEKNMEGVMQIKGLMYGLLISLFSAIAVSIINVFLYTKNHH